ncbi:DgyrCDS14540 [Dimorphilus gyrociliatus]|uniref:DgyrCDS14540 n=1 Tax=Dimorphilus gyrociliatus TaxID=2664684 RepID=A0A7I8WE53_9ANNE|nr:DgyrCDS14540 [Dimorphilus gyrociliatus]
MFKLLIIFVTLLPVSYALTCYQCADYKKCESDSSTFTTCQGGTCFYGYSTNLGKKVFGRGCTYGNLGNRCLTVNSVYVCYCNTDRCNGQTEQSESSGGAGAVTCYSCSSANDIGCASGTSTSTCLGETCSYYYQKSEGIETVFRTCVPTKHIGESIGESEGDGGTDDSGKKNTSSKIE